MSAPLPVEIVRPKHGAPVFVGRILGAMVGLLLRSWVLMLLLGAAHERIDSAIPALGYVEALLAVLIVAMLAPGRSDGLWWISRDAKAAR